MIDIQSASGLTPFDIEAVGVCGVDYPVSIHASLAAQSGRDFMAPAKWTMSARLPAQKRGTHMSRFVEMLEQLRVSGSALTMKEFASFCGDVRQRLETAEAVVAHSTTWFRSVTAPVSKKPSALSARIGMEGRASAASTSTKFWLELAVKSLCPCSKAISDRGAHNQRSMVRIEVEMLRDFASDESLAESLARVIDAAASSPVFPLMKREDEKFVTEYAYDHPVFVEDLVRGVAAGLSASKLASDKYVKSALIEARNIESIHAHDCFARVRLSF